MWPKKKKLLEHAIYLLTDSLWLFTAQKKEECVSLVRLFATPWTIACQAPLSVELSGVGCHLFIIYCHLLFINTGVGCYSLLQRIFPTQGLNTVLLHCRQILYRHQRHQRCNANFLQWEPFISCFFSFWLPHAASQDLSSWTKDWIWALSVKTPSPNHCTSREVPRRAFLRTMISVTKLLYSPQPC